VISAVAIALAATAPAAGAEPSRVFVGPFTIMSTLRKIDSFPYPYTEKTTSVHWTSADQLVEYHLSDDGQSVSVVMTFKTRASENRCRAILSPMPLKSTPVAFFDTKVAMTWACQSGAPDNRAVPDTPDLAAAPYAPEIAAARSEFPKAYAVFLDQTRKLHGDSDVRCLKFGFGNHGPVCVQRADQ
jgi:hypothetical protein